MMILPPPSPTPDETPPMGEDTRWWPMREMTADERRFFTESVRPLGEVVGTYDDASRVDPAPAVDPSRSNPSGTSTLATPAPSPVSGEPECAFCGHHHPPAIAIHWLCECGKFCHAELASLLSDRERLTRELDEMRADKARLDWLECQGSYVSRYNGEFEGMNPHWETHIEHENGEYYGASARAAIDAARASLPSAPSDRE